MDSRIASVLSSKSLGEEITGFPSFELSDLNLPPSLNIELPLNRRLGHFIEVIVSNCIKSSENYRMIDESIQIIEDKNTLGELDFILEEKANSRLIHLELAYKFYLYDPGLSQSQVENWIGPNRNDFLIKKLEKLRHKQFPLLHHASVKKRLQVEKTDQIDQRLCLLASLYLPFQKEVVLDSVYHDFIKGYYFTLEEFEREHSPNKRYYLPTKTEWGIDPSTNKSWSSYADIEEELIESLTGKRSRLCWQKVGDEFQEIFVVWW